ncbi:unnamed protein product [Adineta steineri]|uniref:Uncharacterized protein n=1 Tax=Adineta steineri TaxID=433720 RepID=A0A819B4B9_9BILA|nr:unnamed protein product [Adineta steineri]
MWKRINSVSDTETSTTPFKDMRYFVYYPPKDSMRLIDVSESVLVQDILTLVIKEFGLDIEDSSPGDISIVLSYNDSDLKPKWSLTDLNIPSGSILRCLYREKKPADLYIHCSYDKQIIKLDDSRITIDTTIRTIRKIISNKLGLPLSVFCLETYGSRQRLYDPMKLIDYDIRLHEHIYLKVWGGYEKFIHSCTKDLPLEYSRDELSRQYQIQIALYIATFYGHVELANSVMQRGGRSDRPVGEHPSRQWSSRIKNEDFPELDKCPIHIAVDRGHVKMVDLFVRQSILCTQIRDPVTGRLPYMSALARSLLATCKQEKQRYRVIYYYLHDKQFNLKIPLNSTGEYVTNLLASTISANIFHHVSTNLVNISLPFYCKIIRWYERARENAWKKYGGRFYTPSQTRRVYPKQGLLGYKVLIDGYNNTFDIPEEQLRTVHSGKGYTSNAIDIYTGFSEDERKKIIETKLKVKDIALNDRKRVKQIATANNQQLRRPRLLLPSKPNKQSTLISNTTYSSSSTSMNQKQSVSENDSSSTMDSILSKHKSNENLKLSTKKTHKKLPSISSVIINEEGEEDGNDEKHSLPNIISPTMNLSSSYPLLPNKLQPIMSSADAYALSSKRMTLEAEQHRISKRQELFTQIKQSVQSIQNQTQYHPKKTTNLAPISLSIDRNSIDVDSYIALPDHPKENRLSPIKSRIDTDVRQSAVQPYERYASASTRSTAVRCLQEASYFKRKSWIKQVEISKEMVKNHVKRRLRRADKDIIYNKPTLLPLRASPVTMFTN